jgi:hypothetical protein
MIVSTLSTWQSSEVKRIQSLPPGQQKEAAKALAEKTFNVNAYHTIRLIFNL